MQPQAAHTIRGRLNELAADIGQLRRTLNPDTTTAWRAERIAHHTESLITMLEPTAAELTAHYAPGDPDAANEAIRIVDEQSRRLRHRLGWCQ